MNRYTATVIKTGNSVALRVPKQYATEAHLVIGEKVELGLPAKLKHQDFSRIEQLVAKLRALGAYPDITDPVAWQREIRSDRSLPGRP